MTADCRRFFRTYDAFDKEAFLLYLKELHRHFGKINTIMYNASQHTAVDGIEFVAGSPGIMVMYLPVATPELSAIEEYWRQPRRDVLVSEYYATFVQMRHTLSEYLRTSGPRLDVMKYIRRKSLVLKDF